MVERAINRNWQGRTFEASASGAFRPALRCKPATGSLSGRFEPSRSAPKVFVRGLPARFSLKDCHWQSFRRSKPSNTSPKGPLGPSGHPSWRTILNTLTSNFRQFSLWRLQRAVWGNEKADSCLIRVNSISHLSDFFGIASQSSACCADRPQTCVRFIPSFLAVPAPEMRLACQPQWCVIASSVARLRAAIFRLRPETRACRRQ